MKTFVKLTGLLLIAIMLSFTTVTKRIIVIDVGHGGKDSGVEYQGHKEKEITYKIAQEIIRLNKDENIEFILTRNDDSFLSLNDRSEQINALNPDLVLSLHVEMNDDPSVHGFRFFVSPENEAVEKSTTFAHQIDRSVSKDFDSDGVKNANFFILKHANCPAALVQLGFLSNDSDKKLLTTSNGQIKIAKAIYQAIK